MKQNADISEAYKARAEQLRAEAATMLNLGTKQTLLRTVASYERLAGRIANSKASASPLRPAAPPAETVPIS